MKTIRVLVVDDSALVRSVLKDSLGRYEDIEIVGVAGDPYEARDKIVQLQPDVLTLDVEMPRMNGVEFLQRFIPQYPLPVVMVSSLTQRGKGVTMDALNAGAVDFIAKPDSGSPGGLPAMISQLVNKIRIASTVNLSHLKKPRSLQPQNRLASVTIRSSGERKIVAIGASTGGVEALHKVLGQLPGNMPGVVVVQHMPAGFTAMFSERLNEICAMNVREARTGDFVKQGLILIAPGDTHLTIHRSRGEYQVRLASGDKVKGHRPSVDVMMLSIAESAGKNGIGAVLTGMGSDGAEGLVAMRRAGARTLAQDKESSVVFGMPRTAYEQGGAERLVPLDVIASTLVTYTGRGPDD